MRTIIRHDKKSPENMKLTHHFSEANYIDIIYIWTRTLNNFDFLMKDQRKYCVFSAQQVTNNKYNKRQFITRLSFDNGKHNM